MKIQLLTERDYSTSRWSGGTTTEIGIGPQNACYQKRDFLWRISSAAVELAESTFTSLPDYERWILTLDKPITLSHNDAAPVSLPPFTVHCFDGADNTRSVGRCTDFNLMLQKGQCRGRLQAFCVDPIGREIALWERNQTTFLYCADGALRIRTDVCEVTICEKECLRLDEIPFLSLKISADTTAHCIVAEIIKEAP